VIRRWRKFTTAQLEQQQLQQQEQAKKGANSV
jgi:hypothetical protein